ncbi:GNAT family N-acetyltransferase [candidate division GN15 bacterium]|nr:GNAT family N-acetyltransferase [candidate division GN15 bacterium]
MPALSAEPIKHGEFTIRPVLDSDRRAVTDVFNYFVENSFAAYPSSPFTPEFYDQLRKVSTGYPFYVVENAARKVVGFALVRPYMWIDSFQRTLEITYFLLPEVTGKGLGTRLLTILEDQARQVGGETLLASISSRNDQSLSFHKKHGFQECGRFERIGKKFDEDFDVVWMQKWL